MLCTAEDDRNLQKEGFYLFIKALNTYHVPLVNIFWNHSTYKKKKNLKN